jgi:aminopeptidase N
VARAATVERRPAVLLAWARHAVAALGRYSPDDCLRPMAGLAEAYAGVAGLTGAPDATRADGAGRDAPTADGQLRLAALEAFATTAANGAQWDTLADLLARPDPPLTSALRRRALARLAAFGRHPGAGIDTGTDAAGGVDPAALGAIAALPEPAAKARVWRLVFEPGRLPALAVVDLAPSFWQPHQGALLAPYAARYLAEIPDLERRHGWMEARVRAQRMFPFVGWTPELIGRAEELAGDADRTPLLRAVLTEQLDDLRRALAVRRRATEGAAAR